MTNTRVLLIHWWCDYFYEVFIHFMFGCPELKPSGVSNTGMKFMIKTADFRLLV